MGLVPVIKPNDWKSVQDAIRKLATLRLGPTAIPTFAGLTLSGLTQGSVIFAGASGVILQDNPNLFWDDTNNRLGIGTASPGRHLHLREANPVFRLDDSSGTTVINSVGFIEFGSYNPFWNRYGWIGFGSSIDDALTINNEDGSNIALMGGNVGIGEKAPETLSEWKGTVPYLTLHNSTHEDTDGGGESRLIYKREDGVGTETACFQFEASHDGSGANDQLGKGIWSVNTGSGLTERMRIDSVGRISNEGTFILKERAAALADTPAYGQIWVKSDTPNTLWFTDDAGAHFRLESVVSDHAALANLDYASAAHTGFEPTVSKGNLTETTSNVLTIGNGTGAVIGSGTTIQIGLASPSNGDTTHLCTANQIYDFFLAGLSTRQPLDATLTSIALLGTAADKLAYTTGVDTWAETALTAFARTILDDANAATVATTIGLGTGDSVVFAQVTSTGDIIPSVRGVPSLGQNNLEWKSIWIGNAAGTVRWQVNTAGVNPLFISSTDILDFDANSFLNVNDIAAVDGVFSGDISCDELTATGGVTVYDMLITTPINTDYLVTNRGSALGIMSNTAGQATTLELFPPEVTGGLNTILNLWGKGSPGNITNREVLSFYYIANTEMQLVSSAAGTGTVRPIKIFTGANTDQLKLGTSGEIYMLQAKGHAIGDTAAYFNTTTGQLGLTSSSIDYKKNVAEITDSHRIYDLRPVKYDMNESEGVTNLYGLIAEEVESVIPELVRYKQEPVMATRPSHIDPNCMEEYITGYVTTDKPDGVHTDRLIPLLLKEVQKLRVEVNELMKVR